MHSTHAHTHTHTHRHAHTCTHTCTHACTHARTEREREMTETKTAVKKMDGLETVLEKVGFKRFWMMTKTQSGRLFQTDGLVQENDLLPNSFVFTLGMTKVRVSDAEHNFLVEVYGCIRSRRYWRDLPEKELKQSFSCFSQHFIQGNA